MYIHTYIHIYCGIQTAILCFYGARVDAMVAHLVIDALLYYMDRDSLSSLSLLQ